MTAARKLQRDLPIQLAPRHKLRKHVLRLKQHCPIYNGLLSDRTAGVGHQMRWAAKTGRLGFPIDLIRSVAQQLDEAQRQSEQQEAQRGERT